MEKLFFIFRYIKYLLKAKTSYGVHSQFVYDFINNILKDKKHYDDYDVLWKHRNKLADSNEIIETVDFGAGAGKSTYSTKMLSLGKIVRLRSHKQNNLKLLYRLTQYYKPNNVLEFGTAAGISTAYIKYGYHLSYMVTMEGCANLSAKAKESIIKLGIGNVEFDVVTTNLFL